MATFYLVPPRPLLEDSLTRVIGSWLPGLRLPQATGSELVEALQSALSHDEDTFLVFREDLPDDTNAGQALRESFGAAAGDNVVELTLSGRPGVMSSKSWRLADVSAS